MELLFVYGTLLSEYAHEMNAVMARNGRLLGKATFHGKLYRISHYPGVVSSDHHSDQVHGEVYELLDANATFYYLDDYEGYWLNNEADSDYLRRKVTVKLADGSLQSVWTYLYNLPIEGLDRIESGDFLKG